jgi:hypothetical protein
MFPVPSRTKELSVARPLRGYADRNLPDLIVPVFDPVLGHSVGLIDVESDNHNVFTEDNERSLTNCARFSSRCFNNLLLSR